MLDSNTSKKGLKRMCEILTAKISVMSNYVHCPDLSVR